MDINTVLLNIGVYPLLNIHKYLLIDVFPGRGALGLWPRAAGSTSEAGGAAEGRRRSG